MQFGLMFFSSGEVASRGEKYRLVIEGARFADRHGFSCVWVPERHFTQLGCLHPNPAVLHAALARETQHVHLRAGSVVTPLHNPIRVAEEWAVVDNLSDGRVGISFASGWHPDDFVFSPEKYADRRNETFRNIETVRRLWRGETVMFEGGDGKQAEVRTYPTPVQPELPVWVTAASNPQTFVRAGEIGANLLTHLFDQDVEELAEKIAGYRAALAAHGHDAQAGQVTVMLHTFLGDDLDRVREQVRGPFCAYLKSISGLLEHLAYSRGRQVDVATLSEQELDDLAAFLFERFFAERSLIGTPERCLGLVQRLQAAGVDEIACLMDFGVDAGLVLQSLPHLNALKDRSQGAPDEATAASPGDGLEAIRARCTEVLSGADFYDHLRTHGVDYGSSFRAIEHLHRRDGEALGLVRLLDALAPEADRYEVHPAFLDACFQVLMATLPTDAVAAGTDALYMPTGMRSVQVHRRPGPQVWSHARLHANDASDAFEGDVRILDDQGDVLIEVAGLRLQRIEGLAPQRPPVRPDDLLYEVLWEPAAHPPAAPETADRPGSWLLFMDRGGVGERLATLLENQGATCYRANQDDAYQATERAYGLDPEQPEHFQRLLEAVLDPEAPPCLGVVYLWGLDAPSPEPTDGAALEAAQAAGVGGVMRLLQPLAAFESTEGPRLWIVTRGAQPAGPEAAPLALAQTPLWGFGRTIDVEHPRLWGGLIDLDADAAADDAAEPLLAAIQNPDGENQIALRRGQRYVTRMVRRQSPEAPLPPLTWREDGSYLVTGGLGSLGLLAARWMAEHGARHLILLSRTALPPRAAWDEAEAGSETARRIAAVRDLEALGARVHPAAVDVSDEASLRAFVDALPDTALPPVRGIIHTAGVLDDRTLMQLDDASLRAVLRPKVAGGWLLHRLFETTPLDFFVLFSSAASLMPSPGQAAYVAAHSFIDALAHHRRALGLPAVSINWGAWAGAGVAASTGGKWLVQYLEARGVGTISHAQGLAALDRVLREDAVQVAVIPIDWARLAQAGAEAPLLKHLLREEASAPRPERPARARRLHRDALLAAHPDERRRLVTTHFREQTARLLGMAPARLDLQQPLNNMGLDSLMAIQLKNAVETDLGVAIPVVAFLQGLSVDQLITQVLEGLPQASPSPAEAPAAAEAPSMTQENAMKHLDALDRLSEEEVDALLLNLLADDEG